MAVQKKAIFTTKELLERYNVVLRTIQGWQRTRGYPQGDFYSKTYHFPYEGVIGWEKIHMPHMHSAILVDVDEDPEQKAQWDERVKQHARSRDIPQVVDDVKPKRPKKKTKRTPSRKK